MRVLNSLILVCAISLISSSSDTLAQQPYLWEQPYLSESINNCGSNITDNLNISSSSSSSSSSVLGYFCNGVKPTCQSYLIFRSQIPDNTIASIATFFGSDPSQLAQVNSVSETATLETGKEVIVPINCSCSGPYYQSNVSYTGQQFDSTSSVAQGTFEDLTTCKAIQNQNNISSIDSYGGTSINGQTITVPLRCACPTKNQTDVGINYLLTYPILQVKPVSNISAQFGAHTMETLAANELSYPYNIYSSTTLLVPLRNPPNSSELLNPLTSSSSPSSQTKASNLMWVYVVIAIASLISFNSMRV